MGRTLCCSFVYYCIFAVLSREVGVGARVLAWAKMGGGAYLTARHDTPAARYIKKSSKVWIWPSAFLLADQLPAPSKASQIHPNLRMHRPTCRLSTPAFSLSSRLISSHQEVDLRELLSFDKLRASGRVSIITTEEFLQREAFTGNLGIKPGDAVKHFHVSVRLMD